MRTALLLPLATVVVASIGLTTPSTQPVRSGTARIDVAAVATPAVAGSTLDGVPQARLDSQTTPAPRSPTVPRSRWVWPLSPQPAVVRPFVRPATAYGAGHRGVDLAGSTGQQVLAVEAGTVSHVGRLAGRGTVTVLHVSGVRSTYEPVQALVSTGDVVARGSPLGRLEETGSHCQPTCLHLGALRERVYLDPLVFLTGGRPVRLLPLAQVPDG